MMNSHVCSIIVNKELSGAINEQSGRASASFTGGFDGDGVGVWGPAWLDLAAIRVSENLLKSSKAGLCI